MKNARQVRRAWRTGAPTRLFCSDPRQTEALHVRPYTVPSSSHDTSRPSNGPFEARRYGDRNPITGARIAVNTDTVLSPRGNESCLVLVHVDKWVKIDVTVEVYARPERGPMNRGK